jgi:hypothetical protein
MTYTSTQSRISKIKQKVGEDLSVDARTHINTYLRSADTEADLAALCTNLKADVASLTGINAYIKTTNAINEVLVACQIINLESSIGTDQFYHSAHSPHFIHAKLLQGLQHCSIPQLLRSQALKWQETHAINGQQILRQIFMAVTLVNAVQT